MVIRVRVFTSNLHNCKNELNFLLFIVIAPIQNGVQHQALTESGTQKSKGDDNEMRLQTAADVDTFREVNMFIS